MVFIYLSIIVSVVALLFAGGLAVYITRQRIKDNLAKKISKSIYRGAMTFLNKEYKILFLFILVAGLLLFFFVSKNTALAFLAGAVFSGLAGNIGMRIATASNARTAEKAKEGIKQGLRVAFNSGSVMGMSVVGLGLLGVSSLYLLLKDPQIIYGFGFGASAIALFARVGGGIYTKAADVGADLVGKVEAGIPEDDPRNPATIADNVGDNVGDVAGMGADLFESYVDAIIAAMVIGAMGILIGFKNLVILPLVLAGVGIVGSIIGNILVWVLKFKNPSKILNFGIFGSSLITALASVFVIKYLTGSYLLIIPFLVGLASGIGIGLITEYFTSDKFKPTQKVAISTQTGSATNILSGFSLGLRSVFPPVLIVVIALFLSYLFGGIYGIAIAAVGMLATLGITLATDTYGPVADNAAGIAEMAGMGSETRERAEALDAVGNTTAAIGKGFAIGAAALTSLVLLVSYGLIVDLNTINLLHINTVIGLFLGGLMPFLFSSFAISSVGRAAMKMVQEVRRQFKKIKGLLEGEAEPDYARCIAISTEAALREMVLPSLLVIIVPVVVGFVLGAEALGGLLIGSIVTGFLLAVTMANSGAAWDNAKKYIEANNLGGKGSESHKAAVVGDTVGDPFKDTAGPSLNILLKLMAIIALIIAPLL
ncbi:MAG: sodium-translocating pyrophosphatase [Candidatus Portnoybacteria bacterium]|nr:sodium-translocating pyrophosphatase [Candidatus Portnoybacteria bacterium]